MTVKAKKADTRTQAHAKQEQQRTTDGKALLLEKLEKHLGVVTSACREAGVSRTQFYEWKKTDEAFSQAVEDIQEIALDFVESKLFKNVAVGDTSSILFYLRTKGIKRGYGERHEVKVDVPQFNDNRTNAEIAGIFAERMKLYGEE